jgi:hypothetical protein
MGDSPASVLFAGASGTAVSVGGFEACGSEGADSLGGGGDGAGGVLALMLGTGLIAGEGTAAGEDVRVAAGSRAGAVVGMTIAGVVAGAGPGAVVAGAAGRGEGTP